MVLSLDQIKQSSASLEFLTKEVDKLQAPSYNREDEDTYWYPEVDKAGNGFAVIRFLPAPEGEDMPWVRYWSHSFKGPTGLWYIENSLTTKGLPDPCSEYNSKLWNTGREFDKEQARRQKRKLNFVANVLVIKDSLKPENNGKVFRMRFGKKIFDKLSAKMKPAFEGMPKINPFDAFVGVTLNLVIKTVGEHRNYDDSYFSEPGPFGSDEYIVEICNKAYPLKHLVADDKFKTHAELKDRLEKVLVLNNGPVDIPFDAPKAAPVMQPQLLPADAAEDDDDVEIFKNLLTK